MRLGATLTQLSSGSPRPVAEWATRLAGEGFESLWAPEVIGRGGLMADPFVALAAAAAATDGVEVGTATVQVPLHHPADLAHRVFSLAAVCGDRLALGVSPGSSRADFDTVGQDYAARFATFDEHLARLRSLLAHGRDESAEIAPAELVTGAPPLLLGSWGANVDRAAREFDGWLASAARRTADEIIAAHGAYRAAGGRRAIVSAIQIFGREDLGPTGEALQRYAEAGFDDAVVVIEPGGPDPAEVRVLLPRGPRVTLP
jgi:alkanesulfonate monooxygenase SsuD/methylene tetrahydromethanopterin reductase-like flavin-dependent oxidoreductase (luciferase family)